MVTRELKPSQVRGLLLLLVLVPLIPTVLLVRLMITVVESERTAARESAEAFYSQSLRVSTSSLTNHLANSPVQPSGDNEAAVKAIHDFYRETFGSEVDIRVVEHGALPGKDYLAQQTLAPPWQKWRVILIPATGRAPGSTDLFKDYGWIAGSGLVVTLIIAAVAAVALYSQLRLNKLESNALATVAHELRTPLSSMQVLVDTLQHGGARNAERHGEYLELIAGQMRRLIGVTENFLTLSSAKSRNGNHAKESIFVAELLNDAVRNVIEAYPTAAGCLAVDAEPDLPAIRGDRVSLTSMFGNLIGNAVKHSERAPRVKISAKQVAGGVSVAISDNGPGIPKGDRAKIFERFYQSNQRLSRSREGCGLGLSIARAVAEAHAGRLTLEDSSSEGSTFAVWLPATARH